MTEAQEIAYWKGYDEGCSRNATVSHCRYTARGLREAYERGFANGNADLKGNPLPYPTPDKSPEL